MAKILGSLFICLLLVVFGWFVGVFWGEGVVPFSPDTLVPTDTIEVHDTIYVNQIEQPGHIVIKDTMVITDTAVLDSMENILYDYYDIVDSLFGKLNIVAQYDTASADMDLSVMYSIPKNLFDVALKVYSQDTYYPIENKFKWYDDVSLYFDSDVSVGFGYSAFALSYNLNNKAFKFSVTPRVSDFKKWFKRTN